MDHRLALFHSVLLFLLVVSQVTPISRNRLLNIDPLGNLVLCYVIKTFPKQNSSSFLVRYRSLADKWLSMVNRDLEQLAQQNSLLLWQVSTNKTEEAVKELSLHETRHAEYSTALCQQREKWIMELLSSTQQRMMAMLCRGSQLNQEQTE